MTTSEYNEAAKAVGKGLNKSYIDKDFILIGNENDLEKTCEVHTQEAWETYLASLTTAPPETTPEEANLVTAELADAG